VLNILVFIKNAQYVNVKQKQIKYECDPIFKCEVGAFLSENCSTLFLTLVL